MYEISWRNQNVFYNLAFLKIDLISANYIAGWLGGWVVGLLGKFQ